MGRKLDFYDVIEDTYVRVVAFFFGNSGYFIDEIHGFFEILEFEFLFYFFAVNDFPAAFNLAEIFFYLLFAERLNSALAGNCIFYRISES